MPTLKNTILLPGGLQLQLELISTNLRELDDYWGDILPYYSSVSAEKTPSRTLCVRNVDNLDSSGMRQFGSGVLGKQGAMIDTALRTRIGRVDQRTVELETTASVVDWLGTAIQLLLLETGHTSMHCAGVARNETAILFPSWGGVGKTAITKFFVEDQGWSILGDDLVIVDSSGTCYPYPRAMVLYPYHKSVFPNVFAEGKGPRAPQTANELLSSTARAVKPILRKVPMALRLARRYNPQSIRIAPSKVFGSDRISSSASIGSVVWLERDASLSAPVIAPADAQFSSRVAGTTLNEGSRHCVNLTPTMFGLGIFSFEDTYGAWSSILKRAFGNADCWMISIPVEMSVDMVPTAVRDLLESVGVGSGPPTPD